MHRNSQEHPQERRVLAFKLTNASPDQSPPMPLSCHPTHGGSQKKTKIMLFSAVSRCARAIRERRHRKNVWCQGKPWNGIRFWGCSADRAVPQSQHHSLAVVLGATTQSTPEHQYLAHLLLYKHSTSTGQCFSGKTEWLAMTWGMPLPSALCPSNCLGLYSGSGALPGGHSPRKEVRKESMLSPYVFMGCLHWQATFPALNTRDQKAGAFKGTMSLAVLRHWVIHIGLQMWV